MKKVIVISALLATSVLSAFAQLKVNSNGNVCLGGLTPYNNSILTLGEPLDNPPGDTKIFSDWVLSDHSSHYGLYNCFYTSRSYVPLSVGVFSHSSGYSSKNVGLAGLTSSYGTGNGIGVFGWADGPVSIFTNTISGFYAGYFSGPTYVNGTFTTPQLLTPSDNTLQENIVSLSRGEDRSGSTLEKLTDMNVISFNYNEPEVVISKEEEEMMADLSESEWNAVKERRQKCREERISQKHYGISTQELQSLYPDLVVEGQDGKLCVNYLELVPILIRSIQELNQKVVKLRGKECENKTRGIAEEALEEKTSAASEGNILYQNTPNPFKEQTTIRFSLADDAKDAAICIFDLSGKMLRKMPVTSGMTSVSVSGYELGEGMFLYTLMVSGQEIDTKRMIISK